MYFKIIFAFYCIQRINSFAFDIESVKILFGDSDCIVGSTLSLTNPDEHKNDKNLVMLESTNKAYSSSESSILSQVNELAQFHSISYSYELTNQEGPTHNPTFTVKLFFGDEEYTGEGKSIKKARQAAAFTLVKSTKYVHPPVKVQASEKSLTPTVLLNNIASKLGLPVTYSLVIKDPLQDAKHTLHDFDAKEKRSYIQKLNDTAHLDNVAHARKDESDIKGPFKVRVTVNGEKFIGEAHTIQNAKHEAAAQALKSLQNQKDFSCLKEGSEASCKAAKQVIKSPISLVYEAAQKRKLDVSFEIIDEQGPAHKKIFVTKCTVGHLESTGQGKSKKESKRAASENILDKLLAMPIPGGKSQNNAVSGQSQSKNKKKNKKNKVIKTTFDKIDRMFDDVIDFGANLMNKLTNDKQGKSDNDKRKNLRSPANEIIELGNILHLDMQFSDAEDDKKSYSLLDMGTKPAYLCFGEGISQKHSRDLAATYGIKLLHKLGFLDKLLQKSTQVSEALDKENYQNIWLQVVEEDDKENAV